MDIAVLIDAGRLHDCLCWSKEEQLTVSGIVFRSLMPLLEPEDLLMLALSCKDVMRSIELFIFDILPSLNHVTSYEVEQSAAVNHLGHLLTRLIPRALLQFKSVQWLGQLFGKWLSRLVFLFWKKKPPALLFSAVKALRKFTGTTIFFFSEDNSGDASGTMMLVDGIVIFQPLPPALIKYIGSLGDFHPGGSALHGQTLIFWAGDNEHGDCQYSFDLGTNKGKLVTKPLHFEWNDFEYAPDSTANIISDQKNIYAIGGNTGGGRGQASHDGPLSRFFVWQPREGYWKKIPDVVHALDGVLGVELGGRIYVVDDPSSVDGDSSPERVCVFDGSVWVVLSGIIQGFMGDAVGMFSINDGLYLIMDGRNNYEEGWWSRMLFGWSNEPWTPEERDVWAQTPEGIERLALEALEEDTSAPFIQTLSETTGHWERCTTLFADNTTEVSAAFAVGSRIYFFYRLRSSPDELCKWDYFDVLSGKRSALPEELRSSPCKKRTKLCVSMCFLASCDWTTTRSEEK